MMLLNRGRLGDQRILSAAAVGEMGRDQTVNLPFNPITEHHAHFGLGWDGVHQGGLAAAGVTGTSIRTWNSSACTVKPGSLAAGAEKPPR